MKKLITLLLTCALVLSLGSAAFASAEPDNGMTADEQAWWDAFEVPEGMDDVELFPDDQLALREQNYETVCRYMQGLSPYLYLLYADGVVTGVAYDFSETEDSMRNSDLEFQKQLDAANAEEYPDWQWTNIQVFQSDDPNVFVIECDGSGTYTVDGEAVRTHADHYLHKFTMEDGLIKEYIEYNNPCQELSEMGYTVSAVGGSAPGSGEADASEDPVNENGLTAGEQEWWDAFEVPEGMDDVTLYPDDQTELRAENYETVCRYMQGLNQYLYLLYADDVVTGVAYDFGGTTNPFDPTMTTTVDGAAAMDAANAEAYPDWQWSNYEVYQSSDPNVFLVECDGAGGTHDDHYMHEFILQDGKIEQYIEFNSPMNEAVENGYEVPDFHSTAVSDEASAEASDEAAAAETVYQDSEEANAIRERNRATVEKYFEVEVNSAEQMALCADNFTMEQPFWGVEGAEEDQSAAMAFPEGFQMPEWTPEWHWNDDLVIWGTDDPTFFIAYNSGYGLQLNDKNELCEYHNIYFHTFKFNDEGLIEVYQEIGNPLNLMDAMGIDFTFPQPSDTLNALILLYLDENPDIAAEYYASQEASQG